MNKDDAWWLRTFYICTGILLAYVGWKAVNTVGVQTGWVERYEDLFGTGSVVLGLFFGAACAWYIGSSAERHNYLLASIGELRKVSWPNLVDTRRMTIIVCVVVGIFAVILAIFDLIWAKILGLLLS